MIALGIVLIVVAVVVIIVNIAVFAKSFDRHDPGVGRFGVTAFIHVMAGLTFWGGVAVLVIGILQAVNVL